MKKAFLGSALALAIASTGSVFAVSYDFDTDQSASFTTTAHSSTNDTAVNYNYDYATHVQYGGPSSTFPDIHIGTAPNSTGGTTKGLRLTANLADATDTDAVVAYPTVPALGTTWEMVFDSWNNYNGAARGDVGSTEMLIFGAAGTTASAPFAATTPTGITGPGYFFTMTGDGEASVDFRYYSGVATIDANNAGLTFNNGAASGNGGFGADAVWLAFFTSPTFQSAGAPGKAWLTVKMSVNNTTATYSVKRPGDASYTLLATATIPSGAVRPFVGYSDINLTRATDPLEIPDQFVVIDNLVITATSSVDSWSLFN